MFVRAIKARPNYNEATVQLATLHWSAASSSRPARWSIPISAPSVPIPEVLFAAVTVARAAKDKMGEEKFSRTLRLEFPDSAQARALKRGSELDGRDGSARAPAAPRSIGERLRAGRERSGLSIAAAAEKLHLDTKVIEALEADRFAELGASVYVRGHLRRYARFRRRARRRTRQQLFGARRASAAAGSHPGSAGGAPRGSAPAGHAVGGAHVRGRVAGRHLVGARRLTAGRSDGASTLPAAVVQPGDPANAAATGSAATPVALPPARRSIRPPTDRPQRREWMAPRPLRPSAKTPPGARDAVEARPGQRQLDRSLRFARQEVVLRRGERGQRADRRAAAGRCAWCSAMPPG